jgi:hypothetical protein
MAPYAAFHDDCDALTKPTLEDLRSVAADRATQGLLILAYPWASLEPLALFPDLEVLKIQSAGKLRTLAGLDRLSRLRTLVVSTPPSWDGSRRCLEVESYHPLRSLAHLQRLTLLSVRPRDLDLAPIAEMRHLQDLHLAGVPERRRRAAPQLRAGTLQHRRTQGLRRQAGLAREVMRRATVLLRHQETETREREAREDGE